MKVIIAGVPSLPKLASNKFTHVISLWDVDHGREAAKQIIEPLFPSARIHLCVFDDIHDKGTSTSAAGMEDVKGILAFAKSLRNEDSLLVHCRAGISRSTAVTFSIFCSIAGPGKEEKCLEQVLKIRPKAVPNRNIVRLADQLLGRDGAMIEVIERYLFARHMETYAVSSDEPSAASK